MACNEWRDKLDGYVDGELKPAEAATLGAHLRSCTECAADALQRVQMKRAVQIAGKRYEPSTELRNKIAKSIEVKSRRGIALKWKFALIPALGLLAAAFLLTSYFGRQRREEQRVYSELADLHVATLASSTQVDVLSTDRHTVKPWFQGKIPFTFNLPDLPGSEFTLLGGRVAYLEQISGAHLIYQVRKHEISVFIFPDREEEMRSLPSGPTNAASFNVQTWMKNGLRYFVIGDASEEDIQALSVLLKDAR
ncbi:MAG: zf-HC2 domain-containing protein [Candidatus Sulfotelmatobacter sp.]